MNAFKDYFLGIEKPANKRIANTQKCLRVSGKHNDLEEVGKDTYHHTMFEMLGNWSFGDYFKKEAINWAWELITDVYKIDKNRLYATVFEGDESDNLPRDKEAYECWKHIMPENRILNGNKKDNFWEMGDQGPCGPCSEIHIDLRSNSERNAKDGKELVNKGHPLVIEIWNLVFIEYNRKANKDLEPLPEKHIDTGMGFERLCMVIQGKTSSYDTDIFQVLVREICLLTNSKYGHSKEEDIAIRVIADHIRAATFSICDGQMPSNNGAGYVIRRILRRAIRYAFTFLNKKKPFMHNLVGILVSQFKNVFPEIYKSKYLAINVIREEEISFLKTLDDGLALLNTIMEHSSEKVISGKKAFEIYDTYGFPIDLTKLVLEENQYELDIAGFTKALQEQRDRSKKDAQSKNEDWIILKDDEQQEFIGYDYLEAEVRVTRYRKLTNKDGQLYQLIFNLTPFYAESGGQVGDKGYLETDSGDVYYIIDTKKENNTSVHIVKNLPKNVKTSIFRAVVDSKQRFRTSCNHSATHLLHQALREVLGTHVEQKGSMVHSNYLRFDFSHYKKLSNEEIKQVEDFVNARIKENIPLEEKRKVPYKQAIKQNAIALFGEKYGDTVRSIQFGKSMELCGGTHVSNTSEIWHFIVVQESAVASGIRRIEAISFDDVKEYFKNQADIVTQIGRDLKSKDIVKSVSQLIKENQYQRKLVEQLINEKKKFILTGLLKKVEVIEAINFISESIDMDTKDIRDIAFQLERMVENCFIILSNKDKEKPSISCYVSKSLTEKYKLHAGKIIGVLSKHIGGKGGGHASFASAGGDNHKGVEELIQNAREIVCQVQ
ncbi:alanine--tRNA ligase [Elysia marginata]|uniref:Alanine--tRNA ligase n=1 Tax=Elysia marginata TaxID=1093978 RepID=A0AAV4FV76_9GAST|nr:alanine--tRNA ligase [Elysia marginata]